MVADELVITPLLARETQRFSYQRLFETARHHEYVSPDCKTTSLDPKRAELVTIAATKIVDNRIITSQPFEVRLYAPQSRDSGSVRIHRIRHQDPHDGLSEKRHLSN